MKNHEPFNTVLPAKVDAADLTELKRVKSKLKGPAPGLTKKNKGLLRKFEDPEVALRLFQLPDQLWSKASSVKRTIRSEAKALAAVDEEAFVPGNLQSEKTIPSIKNILVKYLSTNTDLQPKIIVSTRC